jgi:hypothetical protein
MENAPPLLWALEEETRIMKMLRGTGMILSILALTVAGSPAKQSLMQEPGLDRQMNGRLGTGSGSGAQLLLRRYPLEPAGVVIVENVQGDISVEAWDRAEAEVSVMRDTLAGTAAGDGIRVDVTSDGKKLELRTLYPPQSEDPVRVNYRLRVPRQVRLEHLRTVVGNIRVRNVEGWVDARTLNGSIEEINVTGGISARTLNGNIAVSLRSLPDRSAPVQLEAVNGHLLLALPAGASATLSLTTVAGHIDSVYALKVGDTPGDSALRATLGQGGTPVRLRTVRGDIQVVQSDPVL